MYGNRDNDYLREALNDRNSRLYRKLCESGPVLTFKLLVSPSLSIAGGVAVHKVEPKPYDWLELTEFEKDFDNSNSATDDNATTIDVNGNVAENDVEPYEN